MSHLGYKWQSYSPSWTKEGTAASIGNGSLVGAYVVAGPLCYVTMTLTWGTTTTNGTGDSYLSLPVGSPDGDYWQFTALGYNATGGNHTQGFGEWNATESALQVRMHRADAYWLDFYIWAETFDNNTPGNGSTLRVGGVYRMA